MNPTKIELSLSPAKLWEFCDRLAHTPGGGQVTVIRKLAREFGVEISRVSALHFKRGMLDRTLDRLRVRSEAADKIGEAAKHGLGFSDGAASILSAEIFDQMMKRGASAPPLSPGQADQLSLTLLRLRGGAHGSLLAEARLLQMEQQMRLREISYVQAAIDHAKEIKAAVRDRSIDVAARMERVRKILFGERPTDWTPITVEGDGHLELEEAAPGAGESGAATPIESDEPAKPVEPAEPTPVEPF
jgi:hypothetical protein